jgi:hypothetical protein
VLFSHVRGVMEKIDATIIFSLSGKKLKSFFDIITLTAL